MLIRQAFKKAIESYTGDTVTSLKIIEDPQVPGTYAIRSKFKKENQDWLVVHYNPQWTQKQLENNLEECEYETWPPVSSSLKFF